MQSLLLDDQHCTRLEGERWRHHRLRLDVHQISALLAPDGRRRGAPTLKCTLVTFSDSLPTVRRSGVPILLREYLSFEAADVRYILVLVTTSSRERPPPRRGLNAAAEDTTTVSRHVWYTPSVDERRLSEDNRHGNSIQVVYVVVVLFVFWENLQCYLHYHILNGLNEVTY